MTYRPAPDVAWVLDDEAGPPDEETVVVARLPDGDPLALQGTAALIWRVALAAPDEESVVVGVSRERDVEVEVAGPDTRALLAELLDRGLLVEG